MYISTNSDCNFKVACYKGHNCSAHGLKYDDSTAASWGYSIGDALGGMTAEIYMENGNYYMNFKYHLIDTYEFPVHWDNDDKASRLDIAAHTIHEYGMAREFRIYGEYDDFVTWTKDENTLYSESYPDSAKLRLNPLPKSPKIWYNPSLSPTPPKKAPSNP